MSTRRLAAILAADVVGFSSMMEKDEEGTLVRIKALHRETIEPSVAQHDQPVRSKHLVHGACQEVGPGSWTVLLDGTADEDALLL